MIKRFKRFYNYYVINEFAKWLYNYWKESFLLSFELLKYTTKLFWESQKAKKTSLIFLTFWETSCFWIQSSSFPVYCKFCFNNMPFKMIVEQIRSGLVERFKSVGVTGRWFYFGIKIIFTLIYNISVFKLIILKNTLTLHCIKNSLISILAFFKFLT